jgi:hypothetical protein
MTSLLSFLTNLHMWGGTPIRLQIQTALFIDKDFYLSLRGWRGIPGRPPFIVLPLGSQCFPWVLLTLFIFLTIFILLLILILFFILLLILILLPLMKVVMMLVLKVLNKLICKVLCLINLIILRRERQRMGVTIRWKIVHVCMPFVKVLPVQNIHWHHLVPPCSIYFPCLSTKDLGTV